MDIIIKRTSIDDIDKLMEWRMEVLHNVFDILENTKNLYTANREYYHNSIPSGKHIAVFAQINQTTVGCGGLCLYQEMPSPDNPTGQCAYLMNIYTRKEHREQGVGKSIVSWLIDYAKKQGIHALFQRCYQCSLSLYANCNVAGADVR